MAILLNLFTRKISKTLLSYEMYLRTILNERTLVKQAPDYTVTFPDR